MNTTPSSAWHTDQFCFEAWLSLADQFRTIGLNGKPSAPAIKQDISRNMDKQSRFI
jgi:hypothetical protein